VEQAFAGHDAPLDLSGLRGIASAALANKLLADGRRDFDRIESLSDEAGLALGGHEGPLALRSLLRAASDSPLLSAPRAAALARVSGPLRLPALVELPADVGAALARHTGPLELDGLKQLAAPLAAALAKHAGGRLSLDGIAHCEPGVEETLAAHAEAVSLAGLRVLATPQLAGKLIADGRTDFSQLREVTPEAAAVLATLSGTLFLDGLASLSPETAAALAARDGDLSLNGLTEISAAVARGLAPHRGDLSLRGMPSLPAPAAAALKNHAGPVWLGDAAPGDGSRP
jgi:hypothetical protein